MKMKIIAALLINVLSVVFTDGSDNLLLEPTKRDLYLREGATQSLHCYANTSSSNKNKLEWERPQGADIEEHVSASFMGNFTENRSHLKIKSFSQKAVGSYKCKIQIPGSPPKTLSSAITIRMVKEEKTTANYSFEDPSATLFCHPDFGDDREIESVVWLKNDTLVTELKNKDHFKEISENYTLIITKPVREDADLYIARFNVKNMDEPYDCHVEYTAASLVLDFDKSKNLIEEDNMELQCKVKGYPRLPVTWYKNKQPLNVTDGNDHIKLSPLDGHENARLIIKSVEFDDAGEYTCEVHSEQFNKTSAKTITVRVKDKLAALWPFLGIVAEVIVLCTIIFIYENRRNKRAEQEATTSPDTDGSTNNKKEGLRYRNTNNPTA